jgi:heme/copper-type cytochrome/quinol oxidase subunit 2
VSKLVDFPLILFTVSFVTLWFAAQIGDFLRKTARPLKEETERQDFTTVLTAALTLLTLILAFSFSMAITRYDQRKNYEEAEANAIGTEYVRADLLPATDAAKVRQLLRRYLDQRVLFYTTRNELRLEQIDTDTASLQTQLWSAVRSASVEQPTPTLALAVAGMNDVLNAQGYTQAAWWNRIPVSAWGLIAAIAICCSMLLGYCAHKTNVLLFLVFALVVSTSIFLVADIDSPRGGVIRVLPQNLVALSRSLQAD